MGTNVKVVDLNFAVYVWAARFRKPNIGTGDLCVIHLVAKIKKERLGLWAHIYTEGSCLTKVANQLWHIII